MKNFLFLFILASTCLHAQDFYTDLNRLRKARLLPQLTVDSTLVCQCQKLMTKNKGKLVHSVTTYGEVLAIYTDDVLDTWLNSKPHRRTLMGRKYRYIGMAKLGEAYCARLR